MEEARTLYAKRETEAERGAEGVQSEGREDDAAACPCCSYPWGATVCACVCTCAQTESELDIIWPLGGAERGQSLF